MISMCLGVSVDLGGLGCFENLKKFGYCEEK